MDTCSTCEFYEAINGVGYCKVTHPTLTDEDPPRGAFPTVKGSDKPCGEYARNGD